MSCCPCWFSPVPASGALVRCADDWLREDGSISYFEIVSRLADFAAERFNEGDYSFSDDLFALVERLIGSGSAAVREVMTTGFLEALHNQQVLPPELWVPLIGPRAREHLIAWDAVYGATTPGLENPSLLEREPPRARQEDEEGRR
jgi:hypothetical protein